MSQFTTKPCVVDISENCAVNISVFFLLLLLFIIIKYIKVSPMSPKKVSDSSKVKRKSYEKNDRA